MTQIRGTPMARRTVSHQSPHTASGIDVSPRLAGRIAGWGILAMALIAPFAEFYVRRRLVVPGDAGATATNLTAHESLFRLGIVAFLLVIILDVLVAWALYVLLKPISSSVSILMAWTRLVFATIFAVAVVDLLDAVNLVTAAPSPAAYEPAQLNAQMMTSLDAFSTGWAVALVFFGIHLSLIGYLALKSGYLPKLVGILLVVAGIGYAADSFILFLVPEYMATAAMFTFVGELVLALWLVIRARKVPNPADPGTGRRSGHSTSEGVKDPVPTRA
ncbi:DUF4386 domain-containing protein [Actinoplanes sp. NPDC051633]|uniref:DUF4386 domain-containing protein n=1 Tax=Actinoplanes sp. NPDC051633 TaxID=3155670 RepID=UPI0034390AC4